LHTKPYGDILMGTCPNGALTIGRVGKHRDSQQISGYQIDDYWTCNNRRLSMQ